MKTSKLVSLAVIFLMSLSMQSQVSVNVNIGAPPAWGPAGYSDVNYYYLPDVESYYDVKSSQFIYFEGGKWLRARHLPKQYRNYDLYHGYKVVLNDYRGSTPYVYYNKHKVKYYKGYHGEPQRMIGSNAKKNNHGHEKHEGGKHGGGHGKGKGH